MGRFEPTFERPSRLHESDGTRFLVLPLVVDLGPVGDLVGRAP